MAEMSAAASEEDDSGVLDAVREGAGTVARMTSVAAAMASKVSWWATIERACWGRALMKI